MSYNAQDETQEKLFEKLIKVNRVTKVNKGGKKLAFRAFVIVGDQNGKVGLATAKSKEVPLAIRRSIDKAKKNMHDINVFNGTIPHRIIGEFKASKVVLRPAPEGTGVIAGGSIRILLESLGIENVVAKSIGSNNSLNMAKAAMNGLLKLKNLSEVEERRGVKISLGGKKTKVEETETNDKN
ncbi:MAG: 30S ribosomal protein S5 [Candidatus Margulisiibacteriota bacterium]